MGTTILPQIDPTALDTTGLSVATSYVEDNSRSGAIYDPVNLAAAAPIWFHPLPSGSHIMVMARRWHAATPGGGMGTYSDYTEDLTPSWVIVDGPQGSTRQPSGGVAIPRNTVLTSPTLVGAASRAPDYLYLLYATEDTAVVQRIRFSGTAGVAISAEETLPTLAVEGEEDPVVFSKGLHMSTPHLMVYGTDSTGAVYQARKPWALLGSTRPSPSPGTHNAAPVWEYFTGSGFSSDPAQAVPLPLTTVGPMGFGAVRSTSVITTISENEGTYTGHFWASTKGRPLRKLPTTVALGTDAQYLGHGLLPQPELAPHPGNTGSPQALVYLYTTLAEGDDEFGLVNTWELLPIS